jgi:hypothetical protein
MVQEGAVRLHHLSTDEQIADIFTKPLSGTSLEGMKMFPWGVLMIATSCRYSKIDQTDLIMWE